MTLDQITTINSRVNAGPHRFALDFYGVARGEADAQADAIADPSDFALVKRTALLAAGLLKADLRLQTCQTKEGAFHAVLLVTIGGAEYVLDHLVDDVLKKSDVDHLWHI
jgi:predicted transglutaminase-like cysteine proteinase